jgi:hypothetical protein
LPVSGVCFAGGESGITLPLLGVVFRKLVSKPTAPSAWIFCSAWIFF